MEAQTKPVLPQAPLTDTTATIGDSATIARLKDAITQSVDGAFHEYPASNTTTTARVHAFVARLSGHLEVRGEQELAEKVFSILKWSQA